MFKAPDLVSRPNRKYVTGHYTQVVWGATTKIGCGRVQYKPSGARSGKEMIICNYGKAGNFIRYIETLA